MREMDLTSGLQGIRYFPFMIGAQFEQSRRARNRKQSAGLMKTVGALVEA